MYVNKGIVYVQCEILHTGGTMAILALNATSGNFTVLNQVENKKWRENNVYRLCVRVLCLLWYIMTVYGSNAPTTIHCR